MQVEEAKVKSAFSSDADARLRQRRMIDSDQW
jgi:hypothetical protein